MKESDARKVLFVRSIEEGDPAGAVLPKADRLVATRKAQLPEILISEYKTELRPLNQKEESFCVRRAELLIQTLGDIYPESRIDISSKQWKGWLSASLFFLAFFTGFIANEFESGRRLNLLAFPVIGMLIWNFAVYGYIGITLIQSNFKKNSNEILSGPIIYAVSSLSHRQMLRTIDSFSERASILNRCFLNFSREWSQLSVSIYKNHTARVMHICAVLFAVGIIGGMYVRGITTEYYAGWESTFLEPEAVHRLMGVVLAPAALITGQKLPKLERIKAIQWRDGSAGENAADWIHLFANTIFLFVILPRCFLAFAAFKREKQLQIHFLTPSAGDSYYSKLLTTRPGHKELIRFVPYSLELSDKQMVVFRSLLDQTFGWMTEIEFHRTIPYGEEDKFLNAATHAERAAECLIILFNLSSIPENEIHGTFIANLKEAIAVGHSAKQLLVAIDESHFYFRFSHQENSKERLLSRRELWKRTIGSKTLQPVFINLHNPDVDDWLISVREALTPLKDKAKKNE